MKLSNLNTEIALFELRQQIGELLAESISDYLGTVMAKLKNKPKDQLDVDLDQLAEVLAGLKILANSEYRESMTKDDLGINPNSYKELFTFLQSIPRDGKNLPKLTTEVFTALKHIAPSVFKKTREELDTLGKGEKNERDALVRKLDAFTTKVNQMFNKIKHGASSSAKPAGAQKDLQAGAVA